MQYAEIIPDLLHVHPGAIRAALRAIPHLYCVTDSTAAAGMPDGEYRLGTHTVTNLQLGFSGGTGRIAVAMRMQTPIARSRFRRSGVASSTAR